MNINDVTSDLDRYREYANKFSRTDRRKSRAFEPPLVRGSWAPFIYVPPHVSAAYPTTHVIMIGEAGNYPASLVAPYRIVIQLVSVDARCSTAGLTGILYDPHNKSVPVSRPLLIADRSACARSSLIVHPARPLVCWREPTRRSTEYASKTWPDLAGVLVRASLAGPREESQWDCALPTSGRRYRFFSYSASLASMGTLHDAPLVKPFSPARRGASLSFGSRHTQFFDRFRPRSGRDDHWAPRRKVVSTRLRKEKISIRLLPFPFFTSSFRTNRLYDAEASFAECKCLPTP